MSNGDRLRKLLEERGLNCQTDYLHTSWYVGPKLYDAVDNLDGTFTVDNLTPEQVVAAMLGERHGTAEIDELLDKFEHECFMLRVEASETRAKDEDVRKAYERIREASAQAIAATLGSERESELQKALNKAAGNWAKADAELRKALDFMRIWISEDAHLGESAVSREFEKAEGLRKLDAIEDAIAATLAGGECVMNRVKMFPEHKDCIFECWECSACKRTNDEQRPLFCPYCGRKVKRWS